VVVCEGGEGDTLDGCPPKKQYSGEILYNLLVLICYVCVDISFKKYPESSETLFGALHHCENRENRVGTDDYNSFYYYYYCWFVFLWRVARKWDRDIACSYILASIFYFCFLRATDTMDGCGKGPVVGLSGNGLTNKYFSCPSRTDGALSPSLLYGKILIITTTTINGNIFVLPP